MSGEANSILPDRLFPDRRPTLFSSHRPLCQSHRHTLSTTLQRRLRRPHLAGRKILGSISLYGYCILKVDSVLASVLTTRRLIHCTPTRTALGPPRPSSSRRRRILELPEPRRSKVLRRLRRRQKSLLKRYGMRTITERTVIHPYLCGRWLTATDRT
jgi:hypothetical protein